MTPATIVVHPTHRVAFNRLLWVGLLTSLAAGAATFIIRELAVALLRPDPLFTPLTLLMPIGLTVALGLGATVVYALIGRSARQPIQLFRRVAALALVATFIPDIALYILKFYPGTTVATVAVLVLMHIVAWAIILTMLTGLARPSA